MPPITVGFIKEHVSTKAGTLPTAGTDLLATAIVPSQTHATLRCDFVPSIAGILTVTYTLGGATTSAKLYGGASLTADVLYPFEVMTTFHSTTLLKETINFQFSETGGTYRLIVREV